VSRSRHQKADGETCESSGSHWSDFLAVFSLAKLTAKSRGTEPARRTRREKPD
jgi:hypothetical protein